MEGVTFAGIEHLLISFSVIESMKTLLTVTSATGSEPYQLNFIHGMRFLSAVWIVLGHSFVPLSSVFGEHYSLILSIMGRARETGSHFTYTRDNQRNYDLRHIS